MKNNLKIIGVTATVGLLVLLSSCSTAETNSINNQPTPPVTNPPATTPPVTTPSKPTPVPSVTTPPVTTPPVTKPPVTTPPPPVTNKSKYTDGTYSATGSYSSPEGGETVSITITLAKDVITGATFQGSSRNGISKSYMANFAAGFKEKVIGKSIDQVSLSVVNGSSLTPRGFMNALQKIKSEAVVVK